jgi:hypothetical protein
MNIINASDFYAIPLAADTKVYILTYSNDPQDYSWNDSYIIKRTTLPILIIQEQRSGECKTKRFTNWAGNTKVTYAKALYIEELKDVLRLDYAADIKHLQEFVVTKYLMTIDTSTSFSHSLSMTKANVYRAVVTKSHFKYYYKVMTKAAFRAIFERIWLSYQEGHSLKYIIGELERTYKQNSKTVPELYNLANMKMHPSVYFSDIPKSAEVIRRLTSTHYPWLFSNSTIVPELKSFIKTFLENNPPCTSHTS